MIINNFFNTINFYLIIEMGNMIHQVLRTKTNTGEIGEATNDTKSYFFIKP